MRARLLLGGLQRLIFSAAGGAVCAAVVAYAEAHTAAQAVLPSRAPTGRELFAAELSVLSPVGLVVSLLVGSAALVLEPHQPRSFADYAADVRAEPVLARSKTAALVPLGILVAFLWCVASAHVARAALAEGSPLASGLEVSATSVALLVVLSAGALAILPWLRRALALGAARVPRLVDPVTTGAVALAVVGVAFAAGVTVGDTGGEGGGLLAPLAIFGVLKRSELDLRPVLNLSAIVLGAYLAPVAFASGGYLRSLRRVFFAATVAMAPLALTVREAQGLAERPAVARAVERHGPLGKVALRFARRATDRDHDGYSPYFGGGDCDDGDPHISPAAVDVPGNGIDEDCSGADTPMRTGVTPSSAIPSGSPVAPASTPAAPKFGEGLNLVLITIDTLRVDVGFMGYPKAVTPNLDALAARSTIFDRAYSMASYTGKSLAPLLIGKYPSETLRDGGHFNRYEAGNVLLAERLKEAGMHTFGAASHWYFQPWSGIAQGMTAWDMTAKPPTGQGDNDTSVTSAQLADVALRQLARETKDSQGHDRRFFAWFHFFDPHAQYMPHEGAPDFSIGQKGWLAGVRAAYDAEVWFTDKHVGRLLAYIGSQPWAARTAIVITSDHGEAFAEHNMSWHGVEIWEPLVRVPLVIYVPGVPPHHVSPKRGHVDLVPTLLDIVGVTAPAGELSGQSMATDVASVEGPYAERDVYLDMPPGPHTGMRRGILLGPTPGLKLVHLGGRQYQLFDLRQDPGETEDLAGDASRLDPAVKAFEAFRSSVREIDVKPEITP